MSLLFNPREHVVSNEVVRAAGEAVERHVALGPVEIGVGEVYGYGFLNTRICGVAGRRARIGKEVEERASLPRMLAHEAARDAVVQEDAGVEVVVEVDRKGEAALADEDIAQR